MLVVEGAVLLNAEVVAGDVERGVRHVADRRDVAGAVPGGADAEDLAHRGDLAARGEAAGLRYMDADVVDQALADQRRPFVRAVEQLAHRDRGRALLADLAEVRDVLGRERVLEEEQAERLDGFGELHGQVRREALVHVVQQIWTSSPSCLRASSSSLTE